MNSADSNTTQPPRVRVAAGFAVRWAIAAVLSVVVAALAGTLALRLTMAPPMSDLRSFVIFLGITGGATLILGSAVLAFLERVVPLSVRAKAFLAVAIGSAVALLNVYVVARLMFISDEHDLPYLFAALVFAGGATMFFSYNAANAMTERVRRIATAVRDLADGRYDQRISLDGDDEVAELGRTVDRLAERLREAEEQRARLDRERRELTAAISHDLRTPLASVRAMTEALADG
ncbi:MAG: HAMP domain-containing protein, partial [Dehalococcoidia bacterium]|nr:HAMP domain-containing protein [Dehalococcoidia bacterium]